MKHVGMLFQPAMILAMLRQTHPKTQTRRPITANNSTVLGFNPRSKTGALLWKQLRWNDKEYPTYVDHGPHAFHPEASEYLHVAAVTIDKEKVVYRVRSQVEIGDLIYAKETYAPRFKHDTFATEKPELDDNPRYVKYRATTNHAASPNDPMDFHVWPDKWKSALFMPKKFARIWRKVVGIRAQQLQSISIEDCLAEGIEMRGCSLAEDAQMVKRDFATLVNRIHGKAYWRSNPWVWVYELEMIDRPEDI
jgi:hypothetical protein